MQSEARDRAHARARGRHRALMVARLLASVVRAELLGFLGYGAPPPRRAVGASNSEERGHWHGTGHGARPRLPLICFYFHLRLHFQSFKL